MSERLTDAQIDALTGRKLDAAVALALGWVNVGPGTDDPTRLYGEDPAFGLGRGLEVPYWSSDIAEAWKLVEHEVWPFHWALSKEHYDMQHVGWLVTGRDGVICLAETAPLAICRAALRACREATPCP